MADQESGTTLADDEARLARYADALVDAFDQVAERWLRSLVDRVAPGVTGRAHVAARLARAAVQVTGDLRTLLGRDIAEQAFGPLEVMRRAITTPTAVLREAGIAPIQRDEFSIRRFPDDLYGLVPGNFADIDPSLHEPGLVWGAAKAHVHLRRRREATLE